MSNENFVDRLSTQFRFKTVSPVNVERALKKIKTSCGFSSGGIASYFLNIAFPVIASSLCKIFNFSIQTRVFPDAWKEARAAPVLKRCNASDCSNYRPIWVLPVISRFFEKLVYYQIYKHLNANKLLYSDQYGFRQLHSVVACLLKCTNDWCLNIDRGKFTAMIFIDLKKTFDTVDLLFFLIKCSIMGLMVSNINGSALILRVAGSAAG